MICVSWAGNDFLRFLDTTSTIAPLSVIHVLLSKILVNNEIKQMTILTEKIIKHFLARLYKMRQGFSCLFSGIDDEKAQQEYIILTIKRLFVLYFLQKQRLLNDDDDYLSHTLVRIQQERGEQLFYRHFFLPLLHQYLGPAAVDCSVQDPLFGVLPHTALPLFALHPLEKTYPQITVQDEAFRLLFTFFDEYHWSLASTPTCEEHELHPDLLAYFCEEQSTSEHPGVYYTREDVATYMATNTIIPLLFTTLDRHFPDTLTGYKTPWVLLGQEPERYITAAQRDPGRLQNETMVEFIARQKHFYDLKVYLKDVHQRSIGERLADFITYNLDLYSFAQDYIIYSKQPSVLLKLFAILRSLTILDPTCGGGAFLFAALPVLERLYQCCLDRLRLLSGQQKLIPSEKKKVMTLLQEVEEEPSQSVFILKQILFHQLYGVDLSAEATATCQLRFYLALLAHKTRIETICAFSSNVFHICTGNALDDDINKNYSISMLHQQSQAPHPASSNEPADRFHWQQAFPEIIERGGFDVILGNPPYIEYNRIRLLPTVDGVEKKHYGNLYAAIIERSLALCRADNSYLGLLVPVSICSGMRFEDLRHQLRDQTSALWLANFDIFPGRLFTNAFQRLSILLAHCQQPYGTHSPYPQQTIQTSLYTTRLHRWYSAERPLLLQRITYTGAHFADTFCRIPKLASPQHAAIIDRLRMRSGSHRLAHVLADSKTPYFVYYQEATNYWTKAVCHIPYYQKNNVVMEPPHGRILYFYDEQHMRISMALLNSSLFYLWFVTYADGFHLSDTLVKDFPVPSSLYSLTHLADLALQLENDILAHATKSTRNTHGQNKKIRMLHRIELVEFHMQHSKWLIDQIDTLLTQHYGLQKEDLVFILHFDRKYRMGQEKED